MGLEQDSDYRRVGIPPKDGLLSSGYVRLDHNSDVVFNRFALYYFLDLEARRIFNSYGTGIRSTLNGSQLVKIPMIFPPISEQQQIAKFLDEKTALIDGIITDTKQTIEELKSYKQSLISEIVTKGINKNVKLVPSGIEWIGEIPKGWKTIPLKLVFNEIGSGTTPDTSQSEFYGDKIYWIQSGDLYQKKYVEDTKKKISDKGLNSSSALKIYKSPFIAVAMYGASIGNISISKIDSCVNQAVAVMSNPILLELEFAYYCLFISKEFLILESKGGTQPNISQEILKNWKIPLPTVDEQKMIIEILDKKTNKIDMIIKEKEKIISEYENYKKSMIYEYVTGKKRVDIDEGDLN
jgi:type I restriction modification DNA specificity domain protein